MKKSNKMFNIINIQNIKLGETIILILNLLEIEKLYKISLNNVNKLTKIKNKFKLLKTTNDCLNKMVFAINEIQDIIIGE